MSSISETLHLLVVDDDEVDRMALRRALRSDDALPHLTEVGDAESAAAHLASGAQVDCVVLDLQMPGRTGLEWLRQLRAEKNEIPIVMLTGHGDEETAVEIMKSGASDYVNKSTLSAARLHRSISHAIRVYRAEIESRRAQAALQHHSDQLRMLAEAATAVNGTLSADAVTRMIADRAREIVGAGVAIVQIVATPESRAMRFESSLEGTIRQTAATPLEEFDAQALALLQQCDRLTVEALDRSPERLLLARRIAQQLPTRGWLAAPLVSTTGRRFGVVHLSEKISGEFTAADESIVVQLAQLGSVAIGNALLFQAERASTRARDDMMAIVSHDLRNPLNTIVLGASFLLGEDLDNIERRRETVLRMQRAARRMSRLLEDLLDVSRVEAGLLTVDPVPVVVEPLVEEALDLLRPLAAQKSLQLTLQISAGLGPIRADRDRILQVFGNLVGNAIKFTPSGGVITVGAEREGAGVRFLIRDTGTGVPREHLPHLFDRYWQARETKNLGTGLGLFIARGIVEAHGGTLWAESDGATGATFYFTLPSASLPSAE